MFIDGYMVDSFKCDNGDTLLTVSYVNPGDRANNPAWEKQAFIHEENTKLCDCLHTIVNYIARLDIPKGGYAKIKI